MEIEARNLAEKDGPPVAELRDKVSELVTGVGHGKGSGIFGDGISRESGEAVGRFERGGVDAELSGESMIDRDPLRVFDRRGSDFLEKGGRESGEGVFEGKDHGCLRREVGCLCGNFKDGSGEVGYRFGECFMKVIGRDS